MYTGVTCVVDREISKEITEAVSMSNQRKDKCVNELGFTCYHFLDGRPACKKPICFRGDVTRAVNARMLGLLIESNFQHVPGFVELDYSLGLKLFVTEADRLREA